MAIPRKLMPELKDNGIVHLDSPYSVADTIKRLSAILTAKQITSFCSISHSGEAAKAGLTMKPTELLIFGSPKAGTPLMIASPSLAIDLPLKALVWEDAAGSVHVSYNSPEYLRQRHNIPEDLIQNIAAIRIICEEAVRPPQ
jgi:uncharacterized protein (DUF302 family)